MKFPFALSFLVHRQTTRSSAILHIATTADHTAASLVEIGPRSESRTAVTLARILCSSHRRALPSAKVLAGFIGHVVARVRRAT